MEKITLNGGGCDLDGDCEQWIKDTTQRMLSQFPEGQSCAAVMIEVGGEAWPSTFAQLRKWMESLDMSEQNRAAWLAFIERLLEAAPDCLLTFLFDGRGWFFVVFGDEHRAAALLTIPHRRERVIQ
jgi:hypothetical protein